jgi:hypothetical protein
MTERKAKARVKEEANPCGMTARKTRASARANAGISPLRITKTKA